MVPRGATGRLLQVFVGEVSMFVSKKLFTFDRYMLINIGIVLLFLLAIGLRILLYPIVTSDYTAFLSQWYNFIQTHGGFAALKYNFSNYNPPYLYLLAITTYLPVTKLIAIKTLSVLFDAVLGIFSFLIIKLKYPRAYAAIAGTLIILFAPTVFINSAAFAGNH